MKAGPWRRARETALQQTMLQLRKEVALPL